MPMKLAGRIIKLRRVFFIVFVVLTVASACLIPKTTINYDFTDYLGKDTVTRKSLDMMEKDFGSTDQLTIMFENAQDGACAAFTDALNGREGILRASHDPEKDVRLVDGVRYERIEVFLECEDSVAYVKALSDELSKRTDVGIFHLSGTAPQTIKLNETITSEVLIAMLIAVAVVMVVLFLTSHSWIDPIILSIVFASSIIINLGTNWIFESVSFVTYAVCAILQLALAMDYSIMLLHNYFALVEECETREEALKAALARSFMPISSSALTTIAGLASLLFMSFTIGFDLGIVLSKGIVISMLTVFLFMPSLIYLFSSPLEKLRHRPLPLGGRAIGSFACKTRFVLPVLLIAVIVFSCTLQKNNEYIFTDESVNIESNKVSKIFGLSNQLVLLYPSDMTDEGLNTQRTLVEKLEKVEFHGKPAVTSITSLVTTGEAAVKYYSMQDISELTGISPLALGFYSGSLGLGTVVRGDELIDKAAEAMPQNESIRSIKEMLDFARNMFVGETCSRMILLMDIPYFGPEMHKILDEISLILHEAYPGQEVGIAGATMSSYDIETAFQGDMLIVNVLTILAVVLIILLSFRSVAVPVVLVCVIQGAIWITLAVSTLLGEGIFFMCYLIITAIMMGATIDYGILLTGNYRRHRLAHEPREAICLAMESSVSTIFTSGVILAVAGFIIGSVCSAFYIYSIGRMLARGAVIAIVLVILLLPGMLVNLDRVIAPKGARKKESNP